MMELLTLPLPEVRSSEILNVCLESAGESRWYRDCFDTWMSLVPPYINGLGMDRGDGRWSRFFFVQEY
jgi:hypothetical protein